MIARLCLACVHFVYVLFLAVCVVIFNFIAIAVRVVYYIIRNLARFLVCHLIAVVTLRGLVLRYCRIAETSLSPRIADSSLYCEFVIVLWVRRRRHIAGSSPYCGFVGVLRVRRCRRRIASLSSSPYCGFVVVVVLRVCRCHHIAGSSAYCGFVVVVVVLRVCRRRRTAGSLSSSYCGFVAVTILRVHRCRHIAGSSLSPYCGFIAVAILWVHRSIADLSPYCEFVAVLWFCHRHRFVGSTSSPYSASSLLSYCGFNASSFTVLNLSRCCHVEFSWSPCCLFS